MELFDFIKLLFNKNNIKWTNITTYDKEKNRFMLNRFMSIQYPIHAQKLNLLKTNSVGVAESWRLLANRYNGNSIPNFIYTKTNKTPIKKDERLAKISKEAICFWCETNECGDTELNDHLTFNYDKVMKELEFIEKNFLSKSKKTN